MSNNETNIQRMLNVLRAVEARLSNNNPPNNDHTSEMIEELIGESSS